MRTETLGAASLTAKITHGASLDPPPMLHRVKTKDAKLAPILEQMGLELSEMFMYETIHSKNRFGYTQQVVFNQKNEITEGVEVYLTAVDRDWEYIDGIKINIPDDEMMRVINYGQLLKIMTDKAINILIQEIYEHVTKENKGIKWFGEVKARLEPLEQFSTHVPKIVDVIAEMIQRSATYVTQFLRLAESGEKFHGDINHYPELKDEEGNPFTKNEMLEEERKDRGKIKIKTVCFNLEENKIEMNGGLSPRFDKPGDNNSEFMKSFREWFEDYGSKHPYKLGPRE
jgi:hypothetical protein